MRNTILAIALFAAGCSQPAKSPAEAHATSHDRAIEELADATQVQIFRSDFALGADASASAGPVGKAAQAGTDTGMSAEILSYARSRGLFAGAELSGAVVKQDMDALTGTYGDSPDVHAILAGDVTTPKEASAFVTKLAVEFPQGEAAPQP